MKMIPIVNANCETPSTHTYLGKQHVSLHSKHTTCAISPNHTRNNQKSDVDVIHTWYDRKLQTVAEPALRSWLHTCSVVRDISSWRIQSSNASSCCLNDARNVPAFYISSGNQWNWVATGTFWPLTSSVKCMLMKKKGTVRIWSSWCVDSCSLQSITRRFRSQKSINCPAERVFSIQLTHQGSARNCTAFRANTQVSLFKSTPHCIFEENYPYYGILDGRSLLDGPNT